LYFLFVRLEKFGAHRHLQTNSLAADKINQGSYVRAMLVMWATECTTTDGCPFMKNRVKIINIKPMYIPE
jgi:hypothetical protein